MNPKTDVSHELPLALGRSQVEAHLKLVLEEGPFEERIRRAFNAERARRLSEDECPYNKHLCGEAVENQYLSGGIVKRLLLPEERRLNKQADIPVLSTIKRYYRVNVDDPEEVAAFLTLPDVWCALQKAISPDIEKMTELVNAAILGTNMPFRGIETGCENGVFFWHARGVPIPFPTRHY